MKKYNLRLSVYMAILLAITSISCTKEYELKTGFDAPVNLIQPANNSQVDIDLENNTPTKFSWDAANTKYGGIVLYTVLFDIPSGDFSAPIYEMASDLGGATNQLSMSAKQMIQLAKAAGIPLNSVGDVLWTVQSYQGGETKNMEQINTLSLFRPDGIAEIPDSLFIYGTAYEKNTLAEAFACRKVDDGVFESYASVASGELRFCSQRVGGTYYKINTDNKLSESVDESGLAVTGTGNCYRIVVDFNLLSITIIEIQSLELVRTWEEHLAVLTYVGNHQFVANNVPVSFYYDWGFPEERYRFWVTTNEGDERWGSYMDDNGTKSNIPGMPVWNGRPDGDQPSAYYNIYNLADLNWIGQNPDWVGMWKFPSNTEDTSVDVLVNMSPEGESYTHSISITQ